MVLQNGKRGWSSTEMSQWPTKYKQHILNQYGQEGLTPNTYQWLVSSIKDAQMNGEIVSTAMPAEEVELRLNNTPYTNSWDTVGTDTVENRAAEAKAKNKAQYDRESAERARQGRIAVQNYERMTGQKFTPVVDLSDYTAEKVMEIQQSYGLTGKNADGIWGPASQAAKDKAEGKTTTSSALPELPSEAEMAVRQAFMESNFNPKAVNSIGAVGLYQIMSGALSDYNRLTGSNLTEEDLLSPDINIKVRNWYINHLKERDWIKNHTYGSSAVENARIYGAYNYGNGKMIPSVTKAKEDGIDVYNTLDWVNDSILPKETSNYINFIVRGDSVSPHKNMREYEKAVKKNPEIVRQIRASYEKQGGILNYLNYIQ